MERSPLIYVTLFIASVIALPLPAAPLSTAVVRETPTRARTLPEEKLTTAQQPGLADPFVPHLIHDAEDCPEKAAGNPKVLWAKDEGCRPVASPRPSPSPL